MKLFLEPLDVLLFRKSQPFAAGEGGRAASVFPPSPIPFQGAIRTAILSTLEVPFGALMEETTADEGRVVGARALIGDPRRPGDVGRLRIRGPYLARRTAEGSYETLFPAPHNVLWEKEQGRFRTLVPKSGADAGGISIGGGEPHMPVTYWPLWDSMAMRPGQPAQGLWLTAGALLGLLGGSDVPTAGIVHQRDLFLVERRAGIEIAGGTRTAAPGKLYSVDFVRMLPNVGFLLVVDLEGDEGRELTDLLPQEGFLPLGGERRVVHFHSVEDRAIASHMKLLAPPKYEDSQLVLLLVTPAVFGSSKGSSAGWLPRWIDAGSLETVGDHLPALRVVSAALGKPIPVGGWDLARRQPKPLQWAVPAGSIYYCRMKRHGEECVEALHGQTISEFLPEIGMGQVLVGRWPHAE
jgi:CRISPR-associated protein Cmr3